MKNENQNKESLLRRVFSEDRVARTKKALSYSLNGFFRCALPAAGVVASLFIGKMFLESGFASSFMEDHPEATAAEMYDELGIIYRNSIGSKCEIDTENLQAAFQDADVVACVRQEMTDIEGMGGREFAPVAIVSVFCLKALPRGAAYFQIAYREAANSDNRVLKDRDLAAMRAQQNNTPPPPQV